MDGEAPRGAGDQSTHNVLSILIPVYNEADLLPAVLARVLAAPACGLRKEIVVVDDGSSDGTTEYLRALEGRWQAQLPRVARHLGVPLSPDLLGLASLRTIYHPKNRGKGAAIRTAIEAATGGICIVQDADLEYDPTEYAALVQPIVDGRADAVFGSRFLGGTRRVVYFWHSAGNKLLTLFSNMLTDLNLTDMETCYKAFRTDTLKSVHLVSDRFGFEPEVTAKVAKLGARVYEVPISYHGRTYEEGKKITWRDGLAALWHIARFNLFPGVYCRDAGHETLRKLGAMRAFNRHLFSQIAPHLGKRVLEVGSGIGNITEFIARGRQVVATDVSEDYVSQLKERFRARVGVRAALWNVDTPFSGPAPQDWETDGDVMAGPEVAAAGDTAAGFDTVVCLNVLEHVEDDARALEHMRSCLRPDGRLVLLVPAHEALMCALDTQVGHYRRYSRRRLAGAVEAAGFEIERLFAFNFWGLFGWWVNGQLLRRSRLPGGQLTLFNRFGPLLIGLERLFRFPAGVSYIAICRASTPARAETAAPAPNRAAQPQPV